MPSSTALTVICGSGAVLFILTSRRSWARGLVEGDARRSPRAAVRASSRGGRVPLRASHRARGKEPRDEARFRRTGSPAAGLALVLFLEPLRQRLEVLDQGRR